MKIYRDPAKMDFNERMFWLYFDKHLWWMILIFFVSFIFNGGGLIRLGVILFFLYGIKMQAIVYDYKPFK